MKVYIKRGNLNYREKKYIAAIEKSLAEKGITGDFTPAENFDDLKRLHDEYCSEDATIISGSQRHWGIPARRDGGSSSSLYTCVICSKIETAIESN